MADAQSGHEKTITSLLPALAGANLIYGLGMLESGVTIDYAQLVMDAEFARMVKFCVPGIPVTDATLSVDVIGEVGPFKDFLSHEDTYAGMRGQSSPGSSTGGSARSGPPPARRRMYDRSLAEARRILETHQPEPLPDGVAAELQFDYRRLRNAN